MPHTIADAARRERGRGRGRLDLILLIFSRVKISRQAHPTLKERKLFLNLKISVPRLLKMFVVEN